MSNQVEYKSVRITGDVAILNDFHFGVRNDHKGFMKLQEEFLDDVFFPKLIKEGINTIAIAGDLFDRRKYISFVTLDFAKKKFFDRALGLGIEIHIIPGNHDITFKNTLRVNSIELLLKDYDNVKLYLEPVILELDSKDVGFVPWICSENEDQIMDFIAYAPCDTLLGHFEIAGFQMYRGQVVDIGMSSDIFDRFDAVYSGHFHHKSSVGNIHYLGSQMEFTWSDYNDQKGFHILRSNGAMEYIKNTNRMFYKILYDDEQNDYSNMKFSHLTNRFVKLIVSNKKSIRTLDAVVDAINAVNTYDFKVIENANLIIEDVSDEQIEDTITLMNETVDNIPGIASTDRESVKSILAQIYDEAQHGDDE